MQKVRYLLREFGDFVIKHMHHDGYSEENILYRWARVGEIQSTPPRDRVLCVDMPMRLRQVDLALKKLGDDYPLQEACVRLWFCSPLQEDGNIWTKAQLAKILHINKGKFRAELRKGQRKLEGML